MFPEGAEKMMKNETKNTRSMVPLFLGANKSICENCSQKGKCGFEECYIRIGQPDWGAMVANMEKDNRGKTY